MSDIQRLIKREISNREPVRIVTVIGDRRMINMAAPTGQDPAAPMWVTDVEFGADKPMRNVPIKSINGNMFYAQRGQTVQLRRSTFGRWQIVGPGDRLNTVTTTKTYKLSTEVETASVDTGFTFAIRPFEFYMGPQSMRGNPSVTFTSITITRVGGSFIDDGLTIGLATIQGSSATPTNNSIATESITDVSDLVLTFAAASFTIETIPTGARIINAGTSIWNSLVPFNLVELVDAAGDVV